MKIEELADAVGVSDGTVSKYENGQTDFTTERIEQFAGALRLTPWQLISSDPQSIVTFTQNAVNHGVGYGTQHNSVDRELLTELRQQLTVKDEQIKVKDEQIRFLQGAFTR